MTSENANANPSNEENQSADEESRRRTPPPTWSALPSASAAYPQTEPDQDPAAGTSDSSYTGGSVPPYTQQSYPQDSQEFQESQDSEDYADEEGEYDDDFSPDVDDADVTDDQTLAEELGIIGLANPVLGARGRLFSVAGKNAPVAEFTEDFLVLHPPQHPFEEVDYAPAEEIVIMMDDTGVLVNEIGERKKVSGARYNGHAVFYFWQQAPGTLKHYAVWFDDQGMHHYLTINGQRITTDIVYKLRNMTHNGELSRFLELSTD